ncbi:MAG: hypothetical protein ACOCWC_00435 [Bacteroidota bacterium]
MQLSSLIKCFITLFAFAVLHNNISAQTGSLSADRPGVSHGTHAVTPGNFYLEFGYQFSFNKNLNYSSMPISNFRFGVVEGLEIFVGWSGFDVNHTLNQTETGLPSLGTKLQLLKGEAFNLTMVGSIAYSDISESFPVNPALALACDYEINDVFGVFGTVQGGYVSEADDKMIELVIAAGLGFGLTENLSSFIEYYNVSYPENSGIYHGSECGIMYLINNDLQIDAFGGYGFSNEIDHYMGVGIAKRF